MKNKMKSFKQLIEESIDLKKGDMISFELKTNNSAIFQTSEYNQLTQELDQILLKYFPDYTIGWKNTVINEGTIILKKFKKNMKEI